MAGSEEEDPRRHANELQSYLWPFGKRLALLDALSQHVRRSKGIGVSKGKRDKSAPILDLPVEILQQILGCISRQDISEPTFVILCRAHPIFFVAVLAGAVHEFQELELDCRTLRIPV